MTTNGKTESLIFDRTWAETFNLLWESAWEAKYENAGSARLVRYRVQDFCTYMDAQNGAGLSIELEIARYLKQLRNKFNEKPVSANTVHSHWRIVKTFCRALEHYGLIERSVKFESKPMPNTPREGFTEAELMTILAAPIGTRDRAMVLLLRDTGLRLSEMLASSREWITWDASAKMGQVYLPAEFTKGGRDDRHAFFGGETWAALNSYWTELEGRAAVEVGVVIEPTEGRAGFTVDLTPAFLSEGLTKFGQLGRLTARGGHHAFLKISEIVGFRVRAHKLRHTAGRRLMKLGAPIQVIAKQLGHRKITTTQHYSEPSLADQSEAIRAALKAGK